MNQLLQQIASQQSLFNRAQEMVSGKTNSELEQVAKNLCRTKGIDYDSALKQFNQLWGK